MSERLDRLERLAARFEQFAHDEFNQADRLPATGVDDRMAVERGLCAFDTAMRLRQVMSALIACEQAQ